MAQAGIGNLAGGMGKFTELRQRLLFVVGALIVYRIGCYVPVPGVNPDAMLAMMQQQGGGIVDMFNMFSGGALHRFSIFALNVMPYISASIVMQLAVHIFPALKAMQKEGESGRRKITQYSRIGAVLLAVVARSRWPCRARSRRRALRSCTRRAWASCSPPWSR